MGELARAQTTYMTCRDPLGLGNWNFLRKFLVLSWKVQKAITFEKNPRKSRKRAYLVGDHGRSTLDPCGG